MEKQKIDSFIKKLSKETLDNAIAWQYLSDFENVDPDSNQDLFFLLFQNEYRRIHYDSSYYAPVNAGIVYVIHETQESGRDGTYTSGFKMYIHYDEAENISQLSCEQSNIYQLLNSIKSYMAKKEAGLEQFIDRYLSDSHQ